MGEKYFLITETHRKNFREFIKTIVIPECGFVFSWERIRNQRTLQQNKAIHVYCGELSDALNAAGFTIKEEFFGKEIELEWDMRRVKTRLWHETQKKLFDKDSTTQLETQEVSEVYETLNRFFSENFRLYVPFPDRFAPR